MTTYNYNQRLPLVLSKICSKFASSIRLITRRVVVAREIYRYVPRASSCPALGRRFPYKSLCLTEAARALFRSSYNYQNHSHRERRRRNLHVGMSKGVRGPQPPVLTSALESRRRSRRDPHERVNNGHAPTPSTRMTYLICAETDFTTFVDDINTIVLEMTRIGTQRGRVCLWLAGGLEDTKVSELSYLCRHRAVWLAFEIRAIDAQKE